MRPKILLAALLSTALTGSMASAQGANSCANATPISGIGSFAINTTSSTPTGIQGCAGIGADVWFSWTAPTTDPYQFSTCTFASYDTVLAAYSGSCAAPSLISCNDDACSLQSTVSISAMAGTTYLIRAGGYSGATGTATMTVALGGSGSGGCMNPAIGPDVIVGGIPSLSNYGSENGMAGYSLGTTSCNVGDAGLLWISNTNSHPVIGQNIYRLENGRFQQLGLSWLKHGFFALQGNLCCSCSGNGNGSLLGVGCSDPYGSGLNGSQSGLGPRFQVNAFSGDFSYPFFGQGAQGDRAFKRIQVPNDDIDPALHPTALYFGEAQYVTPDDAAAGNHFNNASWVPLNRTGGQTAGAFDLGIGGATTREQGAIRAWAENEPTAIVEDVMIPGEGMFVAGSNVIDNGDGTWNYEYAVFNLNSDFGGQSFTVPVGAGATITGVGSSFPLYHSGEPYTNVGWSTTIAPGVVTWESETYTQNANGNALRWGTTYSFWFTADVGPEMKSASIGMFKPGNPGPVSVALEGPMDSQGNPVIVTSYCAANPNTTGQTGKLVAMNVDLTARTMELNAFDLPTNKLGIFLTSLTPTIFPNPFGSAGNLCLGGSIGRIGNGGSVFDSGLNGAFATTLDLDMVPGAALNMSVMAGETRYFQAWHRDGNSPATATSNFTEGVYVEFP